MSEKHHHHWKVWLTLFVIVGILGLVFYKGGGNEIISFFKVGKFTKSVPASLTWFQMELNSEKDAFYGLSFKVSDTNFIGDGVCQQTMKLGELNLQKTGTRCKITVSGFNGDFTYTQAGSIQITADSSGVVIDDVSYSSGKPIHVEMELIPFTFSLSAIEVESIPLSVVKGELKKFKDDGSISSIAYLDNSSIEVENFVGSLVLENGKAMMNGLASSVKGLSW